MNLRCRNSTPVRSGREVYTVCRTCLKTVAVSSLLMEDPIMK